MHSNISRSLKAGPMRIFPSTTPIPEGTGGKSKAWIKVADFKALKEVWVQSLFVNQPSESHFFSCSNADCSHPSI